MIFPRERVVYEHLNTSFTQLDAMLNELKTDLFTGYVRLGARDYEGVVLLDAGRVVNAVEAVKGERHNGAKAFDGVLAKSRERDGMISVFQLSAEMTNLLANLSRSRVLYKDLASDLTSLDRLIAGLQARHHSGYIDVQLSGGRATATIFMREGDVLEAVLYQQGTISDGPKVLDDVVRAASSDGATFTVYGATLGPREAEAKSAEAGADRPEFFSLWQDVLKTIESGMDAAAKPGTFWTAFRRACVDLADSIPFLDPFAAEFEYREGQIRYDGQAGVAELNQGLSRCLAHCVRALAAQSATRDAVARLSSLGGALKKRHGQRLAEVGLVEALPDVFGV
jgi:hypothetical protein